VSWPKVRSEHYSISLSVSSTGAEDLSSAVFGIEKYFSILSVQYIEVVGFAFDIEK
jgi:hypothetical protein